MQDDIAGASSVTALLAAWNGGDEAARDRLLEAVYDELRQLARAYMRRERPGHTLSPTALVHEAYFKLVDQRSVRWQNRVHFFAVAAQAMRRILVDQARAHAADKRGAAARVPLKEAEADAQSPAFDADLLALDAALDALAAVDARQSRLVELRYFGGLTVEETALALGVAPVTVKRDWALARAWLFRRLR